MTAQVTRRVLLLSAVSAMGIIGAAAQAQAAWPERPVTIVVPFPPGGSTDALARAAANYLSETIGQSFVVENRAGANGNIGAGSVATGEDTDHTFMITTNGPISNSALLYTELAFDPLSDFAPIAPMVDLPILITAPIEAPYDDIPGLIAAAQAAPGDLLSGNGSLGTVGHLVSELFAHTSGIELTQIPYAGSAPLTTDVLGGHVDVAFDFMTSYLPHVAAGTIKALAVTTAEPVAQLPDVPTVQSQGLEGFAASGFISAWGHKDMPEDVAARLNAELNAFLQAEGTDELLYNLGLTATGGTASELSERVAKEVATWGPIVEMVGITLQ